MPKSRSQNLKAKAEGLLAELRFPKRRAEIKNGTTGGTIIVETTT